MVGRYLARGLLAGVIAAMATFGFAKLVGEPPVNAAIAVEEANAEAHAHGAADTAAEPELVSRRVQSTFGLGLGLGAAGLALGGLFALAFAGIQGRIIRTRSRSTAALLAASAFVTIFLVPFLKYPGNPPAVGNPDTIGRRTALYFTCVALSLLAMVLSAIVRDRLRDRMDPWDANLTALAVFVIIVGAIYAVLPDINEVGAFPASVLWRFRVASIGTQATMWTGIGLAFGVLSERAERAARRQLIPA